MDQRLIKRRENNYQRLHFVVWIFHYKSTTIELLTSPVSCVQFHWILREVLKLDKHQNVIMLMLTFWKLATFFCALFHARNTLSSTGKRRLKFWSAVSYIQDWKRRQTVASAHFGVADTISILAILERFSNDCRKTNAKVITPTNHNRRRKLKKKLNSLFMRLMFSS